MPWDTIIGFYQIQRPCLSIFIHTSLAYVRKAFLERHVRNWSLLLKEHVVDLLERLFQALNIVFPSLSDVLHLDPQVSYSIDSLFVEVHQLKQFLRRLLFAILELQVDASHLMIWIIARIYLPIFLIEKSKFLTLPLGSLSIQFSKLIPRFAA